MSAEFTLGPISAIRVWVRDLQRARDFFGRVLGLEETYAGDVATFKSGPVTLVVETAADDDAESLAAVGRFVGVSFAAPDAWAAYEALRARGVRFVEPPQTQPWGGTLVHFADPDGNVFTIAQLPI